jgi:hypothetical protein
MELVAAADSAVCEELVCSHLVMTHTAILVIFQQQKIPNAFIIERDGFDLGFIGDGELAFSSGFRDCPRERLQRPKQRRTGV